MIVEPLTTRGGTYTVALPADKSLTHRALILAACAAGRSVIVNPSSSRDCQTTIGVLQQLGVSVSCIQNRWEVSAHGGERWQTPSAPLDFGNSGTAARLLIALLASQPGLTCVCHGDESLRTRPMGRVVHWLRGAGAHITGENGGEHLPLAIVGRRLQPFRCRLEIASAQVKSALLLAAMNITGEVRIDLPAGTRSHTEYMLRAQGVACHTEERAGRQHLRVRGPYTLRPQRWHIAADPSAAAFFVVLGVLSPRAVRVVLPDVLADDNRLAFLRVIRAMGGEVQCRKHGEGVCELSVRGGAQLRAAQLSAAEIPALIDEVPILTVLAMFAAGRTEWHGVGELRYKECDRLQALVRLCRAAGRTCQLRDGMLAVQGSAARVAPYTFDAQGDHRLCMAASICASFATQPCELKGSSCVEISFPHFFSQLRTIRQGG